MLAQQKNIDTIANNIANINTAGYSKNRVLFKDSLYTVMINPENPGSEENLMLGSGVLTGSTLKVHTESVYTETGNALDLSIYGDGYFAVEDENGEFKFTRDGSFQAVELYDKRYLVNAGGNFVLDGNMKRITLDKNAEDIKIYEDGTIAGTDTKVCVVNFANPEGLLAEGGNLSGQTEASGEFYIMEQAGIKQGVLEGSNVSVTEEMTGLVRALRAYQIASKAVGTADEMEALANNLRA